MSNDSRQSLSWESLDSQSSDAGGGQGSLPNNVDGSHGSISGNIDENHGSQPIQRRRKRSVTMLTKHKKISNVELEFNENGEVIGRYERRFSSWVGVTTRSMVSITEKSWDKVDTDIINLLWLAIKDHWNIKDDKYRVLVLKVANTSWKNFKKSLIKKYLKQGFNPCSDYSYLDEETWEEFCIMKSTEEFLAISEKGRKNAALNKNPARLGARGYRSNQDYWSKEMLESGYSSELFQIQDERARKFLLARRVRAADGTLKIPTYLKELADKIIEKDRQASEGLWIPGPGEDVLIEVLGPEHPGRTRGVSHIVGLRMTIPRILEKKRKLRTPVDTDWEEKRMNFEAECEEKRKNFAAECEEKKMLMNAEIEEDRRIYRAEMEENKRLLDATLEKVLQLTSKLNETHEGSPSPGMRKSSCGSVHRRDEFDGVHLPAPCELLVVDGNYKFPCAKGMVHSIGDGLCHSVPVTANYVKVFVDQVNNYFANFPLPVPNEEMTELAHARNTFTQWPRDAIVLTQASKGQNLVHDEGNSIQPLVLAKSVPKSSQPLQERRKKTTPKKKTVPSKTVIPTQTLMKRPKELQSLYRRWESLSNPKAGISIQVEPGVFGSQPFEFMIFREDIHSLVKNSWIDHTIIAWFQMFLHGIMKKNEKNRCGFICPFWINAKECVSDKDGVISKMASVMSDNRELLFFLAPYLQSNHWVLLLIFPRRRIAYILDSLMSKEKTVDFYMIKEHVEAAVKRYHEEGGPCDTDKSMPFRWEFSKCNQQVSGWECGYYVMHFMFNFVMYHQSQFMKKVPWYDTTPLTEKMMDVMVVTWAKQFSSTYLKHVKN